MRLTASGAVPAKTVRNAALYSFLLAALAGLVAVAVTAQWWLVAVGAACIAAAWFYTGGKRPYGYSGLGELAVMIFFGLVPTVGTTYLQVGHLDQTSVLDLAEALHPTAAVAGTPRLEALELIRQLEPSDRGGYAGPIGWVDSHGDGEWVIGLRGAAIVGDKIVAHAGCGIVLGSNPAAELAETELKFQPIRHALG